MCPEFQPAHPRVRSRGASVAFPAFFEVADCQWPQLGGSPSPFPISGKLSKQEQEQERLSLLPSHSSASFPPSHIHLSTLSHTHPTPSSRVQQETHATTMSTKLAVPTTVERIEAPVTLKAYLMCAFASFGGIFFG